MNKYLVQRETRNMTKGWTEGLIIKTNGPKEAAEKYVASSTDKRSSVRVTLIEETNGTIFDVQPPIPAIIVVRGESA